MLFKVCGYCDPCFNGLTFRALLYIMVYILGEEGLIVRQKAKVFTNGRSQAVRLPAAFRFDTKEVFIDRNPRTGDVILSRKPANWRAAILFRSVAAKRVVPLCSFRSKVNR